MVTKNKLPKYGSIVSIVPGGTIQFLDLAFDTRKLGRLKTEFHESEREVNEGHLSRWALKCLRRAQEGDHYIDCQTDEPFLEKSHQGIEVAGRPTYAISPEKALEPFLNNWVPLPFFRAEAQYGNAQARHRNGPTDWARIKVVALKEPDNAGNTHLAVIALDTHTQDDIDVATASAQTGYPAISVADMNEGAEFAFFSQLKNNAWFLSLDWINDWLLHLHLSMMRKNKPGRSISEENLPYRTEHLGRYVAFLELLGLTGSIPRVRLIDPRRHTPIDVDLVLDIGNSRTIGMLLERQTEESLSLNNGSILELRDLSRGTDIYSSTFSSGICFAKAHFGDDSYAHGAGRMRQSFGWPSAVRVGPEASRLSSLSRREQGETSMSSPKRYLWDVRARLHQWSYAPDLDNGLPEETPVNSGAFVGFINNNGWPLPSVRSNTTSLRSDVDSNDPYPVTDPKFSRSSLMMFLLGEILSQALVQINSPAQRGDRPTPDIARRLRRVILTVPPAMPLSERKTLMRWAQWAVDVVWNAQDWTAFGDNQSDYRCKPTVQVSLDEASSTQIVFAYNEIAEKFSGDSEKYFETFGKSRERYGAKPSLRIASIDIGGGTTDAVVTTYVSEAAGSTSIIVPHQEFRESFNFAGDDLLKVVIEKFLIPEIGRNLVAAGKTVSLSELSRKFTQNGVGVSQRERNIRTQFTQQVLSPIGLKVLEMMESIPVEDLQDSICSLTAKDFLSNHSHLNELTKEFLGHVFNGADETSIDLTEWSLSFDLGEVAVALDAAISPYLVDLSEVIHRLDCDYLLLSGRPSCSPTIQAILNKTLPLAPARIIAMSNYVIESWYPFWTPGGRIDDPKTTGVVGAMLASISEGNLLNFHFRTRQLKPASTIKFIGTMGIDKQIRTSNLLFGGINVESSVDEDFTGTFEFAAPFYIGYRQMRVERWKTTPFYFVSLANQQATERSMRHGFPYQVTFSYHRDRVADGTYADTGDTEGGIKIEEIIARDGSSIPLSDIDIQMKSLGNENGHWFDTGLFDIQ